MKVCPECQRYYAKAFEFCPRDGCALRATAGAMEDPSDPLLGLLLGGTYRIEACLSSGEATAVYAATREGSDRPVVVKVLQGALLLDEVAVQRFQRRARAASRLQHPGIVAPLAQGLTDNGAPYVVMEFVSGDTLQRILTELPAPERSVAWLVETFKQIAQALGEAHKKGVAAWDLTEDKVMIRQGLQGPAQVKLLDWGLSAKLRSRRKITKAEHELLTQAYEAPKRQVAGLIPLDVLAFGDLLFSMVTGRSPEGRDGDEETFKRGLQRWTASQGRALLPAEATRLTDLVLRCIAPSPAARPRSMAEIVRALDRISETLAGPPARPLAADEAEAPVDDATTEPDVAPQDSAALDGDTSEGIPDEPINTISQVRRHRGGASHDGGPEAPSLTRRYVVIALVCAGLFILGLTVGLLLAG